MTDPQAPFGQSVDHLWALALDDTTGAEPAVAGYDRALQLDPEFADALSALRILSARRAWGLRGFEAVVIGARPNAVPPAPATP